MVARHQAELGRSAAGGAASLAGAALEQYETACAEAVGSLASLSPAASNASEERRDKAAWALASQGLPLGGAEAPPSQGGAGGRGGEGGRGSGGGGEGGKVEAEKARGERCAACARRLPLTAALAAKCRCGSCYCNEHRAPECHACNFDFRGAARRRLEADHPKLSAPKIERLSSAVE